MKATTSGTGQGRTYGGQSSGERQAERKERLIRAAIATYGEQGYRHTTVSDVCRMAGLTPRYFYESFVNSEALLIAAYKAVTRIALETQQAAASELDEAEPEARLQAMLSAYYALLRDKPTAARVFVTEMSGISAAVDAAFDQGLAKFARLLARTQKAPIPPDLTRTRHAKNTRVLLHLNPEHGIKRARTQLLHARLRLSRTDHARELVLN